MNESDVELEGPHHVDESESEFEEGSTKHSEVPKDLKQMIAAVTNNYTLTYAQVKGKDEFK